MKVITHINTDTSLLLAGTAIVTGGSIFGKDAC